MAGVPEIVLEKLDGVKESPGGSGPVSTASNPKAFVVDAAILYVSGRPTVPANLCAGSEKVMAEEALDPPLLGAMDIVRDCGRPAVGIRRRDGYGKCAAVLGVPLISPVVLFRARPGGRSVAENDVALAASSRYKNGFPTVLDALAWLERVGTALPCAPPEDTTVMVTTAEAVPASVVTVTGTEYNPGVVGIPRTTPFVGSTPNPGGRLFAV